MMQVALIHWTQIQFVLHVPSLGLSACFFSLTYSFTSSSSSSSSGSLTAWLDIYSSQAFIRPTWPPLVSHHYFPSLSAIFSMPALFKFFPHLLIFSAPLSLFFYLTSWYFEIVFLLFFGLYNHCFTMPWAKLVLCSFHSLSLETLFENTDTRFNHVLWRLLNVFTALMAHSLLISCFMNHTYTGYTSSCLHIRILNSSKGWRYQYPVFAIVNRSH